MSLLRCFYLLILFLVEMLYDFSAKPHFYFVSTEINKAEAKIESQLSG